MRIVRKLWLVILSLTLSVSSRAVLNERDLAATLGVLADELTEMSKELEGLVQHLTAFNDLQHEQMITLMSQSDKTALILYSQHEEYVFNVTYACNQATEQYEAFQRQRQPYDDNLKMLEARIARFNSLIAALRNLPPRVQVDTTKVKVSAEELKQDSISAKLDSLSLTIDSLSQAVNAAKDSADRANALREKAIDGIPKVKTLPNATSLTMADKPGGSVVLLNTEQQVLRDSCIVMAERIRDGYTGIRDNVKRDLENYNAIAEKLKSLNDYAQERYKEIQTEIFHTGDTPFPTVLAHWGLYCRTAIDDARAKYVPNGYESTPSSWSGPLVFFFTFTALIYLAVAIGICNILFRYFIPKKRRTENFEKRKNYLIVAASMLLFSLVMVVMRYLVSDSFLQMACGLMTQFSLLTTVIVASLLFRYEPEQLKSGFMIYLPVITMGFLVILSRIIMIPNSVANIAYPLLLTVLSAWQIWAVKHYQHGIKQSDIVYVMCSLLFVVVACVFSWLGYTMVAIQIFTWWILQLTFILGIACCYDWLREYEENILFPKMVTKSLGVKDGVKKAKAAYKNRSGIYYKLTWLPDLINITILPLVALLSFPFCIAWATGIFNLTETFKSVFMTDFIDIEGVCQLSLFKIIMVVGIFFVFRYVSYILKAVYRDIIENRKEANTEANMTLANNIISIAVWGLYCIFCLVLLKVPKSGITVVTAGLATGLGFAMKDVINNFIYGLSLMTGRVRVGETIECDGIRGTVESITYQSTQIATIDGGIIAFLNSSLFSKNFKNLSRNHDYELLTVPFGVAYGTDSERVKELVAQAVKALVVPDPATRKDNIDPNRPIAVRLTDFGDNSVNFLVVLWVRVNMKPPVTALVNEAIYKTLNDNGIEIPFPQRDVHIIGAGSSEQGTANSEWASK